jgi:hypothetical protein
VWSGDSFDTFTAWPSTLTVSISIAGGAGLVSVVAGLDMKINFSHSRRV